MRATVADVLKLMPGYNVQEWANAGCSDIRTVFAEHAYLTNDRVWPDCRSGRPIGALGHRRSRVRACGSRLRVESLRLVAPAVSSSRKPFVLWLRYASAHCHGSTQERCA